MISSAENTSQNHPKLIMMDQVYIIFDVDCEGHATEKVHISKVARAPLVAFRFQTNAPTRYIVSPKSGVLDNRNPLPVKIILHGNHYNPNHMLLVQAVEVKRKEDAKTIWDDPNLDCCDVQTIRFQLGTTIVSINKALGFDDTTKKVQASISQALLLSRRVGKEKVQELEGNFQTMRHSFRCYEEKTSVIKS
ncbi:hypothetical protein RB195_004374 [Necator americanus]|uniref:Major sperm protein n=2 Tax=Necator americanus TaxID=51031 RepID=A0ABR1BHN5_NECAM